MKLYEVKMVGDTTVYHIVAPHMTGALEVVTQNFSPRVLVESIELINSVVRVYEGS